MMEHSAGAAAVVAPTATATTMTTNGSLGESQSNKQLGNGTSTSSPSTVCYLANGGGSGHIDRLNLVLPLTSSSSSTTTIPTTTELPLIFSPTSQLPQLNSTSLSHPVPNSTDNHLVEEGGDVDRTPVNTATETKGRLFSFSSLASSTSSSSNSCRTVDSGTESLCSGDGGGAPGTTLHDGDHSHSRHPHSTATDLAADRILKFFASEDSKSSRFAAGSHRQRRRPTSANIRQTSTEDDDDVDEEEEEDEEDDGNGHQDDQEDVYSDDESTLSEASVSPSAEFAPSPAAQLITPESVVAAIDAKIKQREVAAAAAAAAASAANQQQQQNRSTMVTADKENAVAAVASPGADRDAHGAGVTVKETVILASPTEGEAEAEAEAVVPISGGGKNYLKVPEEGADYEIDDELDIEEYGDGDDGDDDGCGPPVRLIRSTSLKTGKTPPGTPRGKKIVRFADALGLDLESVRHIVDDGKPYMPPLAAFKGLALDDEDRRWFFGGGGSAGALTGIGIGGGGGSGGGACSATAAEFSSAPTLNSNNSSGLFTTIPTTNSSSSSSSSLATTTPHLRMLFAQPSSDPGPFLERVRSHRLCLENCLVSGPSGPADLFTVTCIARVLNVGFEKSLLLRYTTNEWLTWTDVPASYVAGSCDGFSDKFSVTFHVAVNSNGHQSMMPGQRLLFALRYLANGGAQEFWDNNLGLNYSLIYQRS